MPSKDELLHISLTRLAALCEELAHSTTDETTAEKLRQLKLECLTLGVRTPSLLDGESVAELEKQKTALRTRVIEFISAYVPLSS